MRGIARQRKRDDSWDIIVIGGGPAGMMAAGRAASFGARVALLEKNPVLGAKLLITGGGRCNLTNAEPDVRKLLAKYRGSDKFLFSPFSEWGVPETLDFFHSRGVATKEEAGGRVFPQSDSARSVLDALVAFMEEGAVSVMTGNAVKALEHEKGSIARVSLANGRSVRAGAFILATGGTSHPETGSTGDGYGWLRALGHEVNETSAALVPVAVKESGRLAGAAGTSIPDAKLTLFQGDAKQAERRGKILFTHVGLSGPAILNMSRDIGELLKYGSLQIEIDLFPSVGYEMVDAMLQDAFRQHANKQVRNAFGGIVAPALTPLILDTAAVRMETPCNSVTRDARIRLMKTLKHLRLEADHLLGMDKAVITSGGVALKEIDWKTMRSKHFDNLYLIGDILDIDRPSGGYSLQLCWTTGAVAGASAAHALHSR